MMMQGTTGLVGALVALGLVLVSMRKANQVRLKFLGRMQVYRLLTHLGGVDHTLPKLATFEQLSPHVVRILGQNPGRMTLQGTNVYIVGSGPNRLMIDCGDGNAALLDLLQQVMRQQTIECITDLLLTHSHPDHIGGLLQLQKLFPKLRVWKYYFEPEQSSDALPWLRNADCEVLGIQHLRNGQVFEISCSDLIVRTEFAPGHCVDHACFFLVDPSKAADSCNLAVFAGDCVLGCGSSMFESLADHLATLRKLVDQKPQILYPGHGPVVQKPQDKLEEYINHRLAREKQIVQVLEQAHARDGLRTLSCMNIMRRVYEPTLPFFLRFQAMKAVRHHLAKLLVDKRVRVACHQPESAPPTPPPPPTGYKRRFKELVFEWIVAVFDPQMLVHYSLVEFSEKKYPRALSFNT